MAGLAAIGVFDGMTIGMGIVFIGMMIGGIYFSLSMRNQEEETIQRFCFLSDSAANIGAVMVIVMILGYGTLSVSYGGSLKTIYWVEYIGVLLITALVLYELALIAESSRWTIGALVVFNGVMFLFGLATALVGSGNSIAGLEGETLRLALWGVSALSYLIVLGLLVRPLSSAAAQQSPEVAMLFSMLRNIVIVLWVLYPIVWLLGPSVLGVLPASLSVLASLVVDLLVAVGFGLILLRSESVLEQSPASLAGATTN